MGDHKREGRGVVVEKETTEVGAAGETKWKDALQGKGAPGPEIRETQSGIAAVGLKIWGSSKKSKGGGPEEGLGVIDQIAQPSRK